jgi:hypothetical protein
MCLRILVRAAGEIGFEPAQTKVADESFADIADKDVCGLDQL